MNHVVNGQTATVEIQRTELPENNVKLSFVLVFMETLSNDGSTDSNTESAMCWTIPSDISTQTLKRVLTRLGCVFDEPVFGHKQLVMVRDSKDENWQLRFYGFKTLEDEALDEYNHNVAPSLEEVDANEYESYLYCISYEDYLINYKKYSNV